MRAGLANEGRVHTASVQQIYCKRAFFYLCMYNILNAKSKMWIEKTVEMYILSFLQFLYTEHKTPG